VLRALADPVGCVSRSAWLTTSTTRAAPRSTGSRFTNRRCRTTSRRCGKRASHPRWCEVATTASSSDGTSSSRASQECSTASWRRPACLHCPRWYESGTIDLRRADPAPSELMRVHRPSGAPSVGSAADTRPHHCVRPAHRLAAGSACRRVQRAAGFSVPPGSRGAPVTRSVGGKGSRRASASVVTTVHHRVGGREHAGEQPLEPRAVEPVVAQQSGRQRLGTPERAGQHRVTYIEIDEILDSSSRRPEFRRSRRLGGPGARGNRDRRHALGPVNWRCPGDANHSRGLGPARVRVD